MVDDYSSSLIIDHWIKTTPQRPRMIDNAFLVLNVQEDTVVIQVSKRRIALSIENKEIPTIAFSL
jgi:hypothetical protein